MLFLRCSGRRLSGLPAGLATVLMVVPCLVPFRAIVEVAIAGAAAGIWTVWPEM